MGADPAQRRLVGLLEPRSEEIAEGGLRQCEQAIPGLTTLSRRNRETGLRMIQRATALRLDLAAQGDDPGAHEDEHLLDYFLDAAGRDIPLRVQLEIVRRTTAFTLGSYWLASGHDHADAMLRFAAETDSFHRRMERVLVDAYCRRLGVDAVAARLRRAHADALLAGSAPLPVIGAEFPPSPYLVLVMPGNATAPAPLPGLADDGRVLHTVREGADVVLVPLRPDGRATAENLAARARGAGRPAAAAQVAEQPADVPTAYRAALSLIEAGRVIIGPPALISPADALPERLLHGDPSAAGELAEIMDRLGESPVLVDTLVAFLEVDLNRSRAARRLFVHRRTLNERLKKVRELTGYDPRSTRGLQVLTLAVTSHGLRGR